MASTFEDDEEQDGLSSLNLRLADVRAIVFMQRYVIAGVALAVVLAALVGSLMMTKLYTATALLHLSTHRGQELRVEQIINQDAYNARNQTVFIQTQLEILRSRLLRERVIAAYNDAGYDDLVGPGGAGNFARMAKIVPRRNSELVEVTVTHENPESAAVLANLVVDVYREHNLQQNRDSAASAREWVAQRLVETEERIEKATAALLAYQTTNRVADAEEEITSVSERLNSVNQAYGDVHAQRVQQAALVQAYERLLREEAYDALGNEMGTPLVTSLSGRWAAAVTQHAGVAARYGEKHADFIASKARMDAIQSELKTEVQRQLEAERARLRVMLTKERELEAETEAANEELIERSKLLERFEVLRVELEREKAMYRSLGSRDDELQLQASTQLNNVHLIDAALPPGRHSEPNVPFNLLVAAFVGLVGGVGVAFAREYIDDTVNSPHDVVTYLRVPLLGAIPRLAEAQQTGEHEALYTHTHPQSSAAEAIRAVRTVLELQPTGPCERLLVTSAVAAEGKTGTCVRLAISYAKLGRSVLVIDGDFRRPRVHKVFGMDRVPGITDALNGDPIAECVAPTEIDGLHLMTVGTVKHPSRMAELMASPTMANLLDEIDKLYDLVIIDSPPSVVVSDAAILSRMVDGVVFVVRGQAVSRVLVHDAIQSLVKIGANVVGVVVNAVDQNRSRNRYYYGYGYRYGYRYRYSDYYTENRPETQS